MLKSFLPILGTLQRQISKFVWMMVSDNTGGWLWLVAYWNHKLTSFVLNSRDFVVSFLWNFNSLVLLLAQTRDGPWPDPSILLTSSKYEADPPLTRVLFDLTWRDIFLIRREKNWKIWLFKGKFSKPKPKPFMADPTRVKIFWPRPITSSDTLLGRYRTLFASLTRAQFALKPNNHTLSIKNTV